MKNNEPVTSLYGKETAEKSCPQIMLRGEIDSLYARAVCVCAYAKQYNYVEVIGGTEDIVRVVRELMRSEATGTSLEVTDIIGLTFDELRILSQNPKNGLGLEHYIPDENTDMMTAQLNMLRTDIRRAERVACAAMGGHKVNADIQVALNRLSSAVYLLMLYNRADQY